MAPINDMSFTEDIDEIEQSTVQRDRANLLTEYEKQQTVNTQRTSEITTRTSETTTRTSETTTRTSESETVFNVDNAILPYDIDLKPYFDRIFTEESENATENNYVPVQIPFQTTTHDPTCQPQPDPLGAIVKKTILEPPPQPNSQPGQLHQQPTSASKSSSNDQGDHVVPSNGQCITIDHNQPDVHQSQPKVHITNQPKSVQRVRYMTEHTHQQLAGQDGLPITLTVTNATSGVAFWRAIICCIENRTDSLILHSNGLHLMKEMTANSAKVPLPLVAIPFELNAENGHLELKLNNVAAHHIKNDQASEIMPEVHSQLKSCGVNQLKSCGEKFVTLPSLVRYRSPLEFRLLFSIMRNDDLVDRVISDPIRDGKPWKIVECVGKRTPILMTEQKELSVFLSEYPNNNKIIASFSYKDEDGNYVVFPEPDDKEIHLKRINQGGGTFITPLFPTPNPSREIKVSL